MRVSRAIYENRLTSANLGLDPAGRVIHSDMAVGTARTSVVFQNTWNARALRRAWGPRDRPSRT